jgi:two-component system, response regulator
MEEKTILLVEDNPDDQFLAKRAFERSPIRTRVITARDGAEALEYLFGVGAYDGRDLSEMPDVTLLDLKMPKLDGLEVLRQMRNNDLTKLLPVVVFSASLEPHDLANSYNFGANSYVRKPIDFSEFSSMMQQLMKYWLVPNSPPPRLAD